MASETWRTWYRMALGSQLAAQRLETDDFRSCASRIYYAAYQAVTAVLLYRGTVPPTGREAWNHDVTPELIVEYWQPLIASSSERRDLANRLRTLYKIRIDADYIGNVEIDAATIKTVLRHGNFIIKTAGNILPGG